jgi:hypothetical protein
LAIAKSGTKIKKMINQTNRATNVFYGVCDVYACNIQWCVSNHDDLVGVFEMAAAIETAVAFAVVVELTLFRRQSLFRLFYLILHGLTKHLCK